MEHKREPTLKEIVQSELKEIIAVFKQNQPAETSRLTSLVENKVEVKLEVKLEEKLKPLHENDELLLKTLKQQNKDFDEFKLSIKPIIDSFNESEQTRIVATRWGSKIKTYSGWITMVAGAGTVLWRLFV